MSIETLRKVDRHPVIEIPKKPMFSGNFSKVYFGRFDKKDVAVKKIDNDHEDDDNLLRELDFLRDFQHENIVRYLFMDIDDEYLYIVLQKCRCTLQEFINEKKWTTHEKTQMPHLKILWEIACGLDYLHSVKNIVHRDLKPPNVLLDFRDGRWQAKLTDFGISKKIDQDRTKVTQTKIRGTVGYHAPETLKGEKIDKRADIYALGIIFYYVMSEGEHPISDDNLIVESLIRDGAEPTLVHLIQKYADVASSLILSMIAHKRENRLYITNVLAHHLFWSADRKLSFLQEVSDYCIADANFPSLSPKLEEHQAEIVGDWRKTLYDEHSVVKEVFENMRSKKQRNGLCDLLRNIRNLKSHYNEKPQGFHDIVGSMPNGMVEFFASRFPKLLPYVYDVMKYHKEEDFKRYYEHCPAGNELNRSSSQQNPFANGERLKDDRKDASFHDLSGEKNTQFGLCKYQQELAENALKGSNSLIMAPVGCGKTAVLAEIMEKHLGARNPNGCVMLVVPETTLAVQLHLFLSRYLTYSVGYITGEFSPHAPSGQKILENKVTILTAQILIKELERNPEESYISFDEITMLIFDECHNVNKDQVYRQIMGIFFDYTDSNPHHAPIQIIGVTTPQGVGEAKDGTKVKQSLLELLANLDVTIAPSAVIQNLSELQENLNEMGKYYIKVPIEEEFTQDIIEAMKTIERGIKRINNESGGSSLSEIPNDRYKRSYEKWTDDLKEYAEVQMHNQEAARMLISFTEHLKMYHTLLRLKDLIPNAMSHAKKMVTFQLEGIENEDFLRKNEELQKKATSLNVPLVDKLVEIIRDEFSANPDARCIVFAKESLIADSLEEYLSQHDDTSHLNPRQFLTHLHDRSSEPEKSTNKQANVLEDFRDGDTKVIIATSVDEEGFDMRACSLVIMYNCVTGEVGRIQRRGSGKPDYCRVILIARARKGHEEDSTTRTACAVQDVMSLQPQELKKQIEGIQLRQRDERKRKETAVRNAGKDELPSLWQIICAKCQNFLTTGDKLRHINHNYTAVKDENFVSRVCRLEKECDGKQTVNFNCNNPECRTKVAVEVVYKESHHPCLIIENVLVRKLSAPKKMENLPFPVTKGIEDSDYEDNPE